ncbi:MAG: hypothetical protein AAFQ64_17615 [Pseudomonadota bacterium]
MLLAIRRVLFRIRTVLGALRAGIYGLAVVCAAWIFLAPPSQTEASLLDLPSQTTHWNRDLRSHRMAKLLTIVGTDRIYGIVANRSGTGLTADQVRQSVDAVANGQPTQNIVTARSVAIAESSRLIEIQDTNASDIDDIQKAAVRAGGAKFVPARSD